MLALTNQDRTDHDRPTLTLDEELSVYAHKHSQAMADAGFLFHTADLAAHLKGKDWSVAGENVGVGDTLPTLEDAFMASKPHRKNILRRGYDYAGIGVVLAAGALWVTVIFYG